MGVFQGGPVMLSATNLSTAEGVRFMPKAGGAMDQVTPDGDGSLRDKLLCKSKIYGFDSGPPRRPVLCQRY